MYFNAVKVLKGTMVAQAALLCAGGSLGKEDTFVMQEHSHLISFLLFLLHRVHHEVVLWKIT